MVVLQSICFMGKLLKIGLVFMLAAVVLMPIAIVLKTTSQSLTVGLLVFTMVLELIGLVFVMMSIIKRRKNQV